jgi:hypothetical protein
VVDVAGQSLLIVKRELLKSPSEIMWMDITNEDNGMDMFKEWKRESYQKRL